MEGQEKKDRLKEKVESWLKRKGVKSESVLWKAVIKGVVDNALTNLDLLLDEEKAFVAAVEAVYRQEYKAFDGTEAEEKPVPVGLIGMVFLAVVLVLFAVRRGGLTQKIVVVATLPAQIQVAATQTPVTQTSPMTKVVPASTLTKVPMSTGTPTRTITPIPTHTLGPNYNAAYWEAFVESYIREGGNAEFWRLSINGMKLSGYYKTVSGNPFWLITFFTQLETAKAMNDARAAGATFEAMVPETKGQAMSPTQFVEKAWKEVPTAAPTADKPLKPRTVAPTRKAGVVPALPTQQTASTPTSTATVPPTGTPTPTRTSTTTKTRTPNYGATAVAKTATARAMATANAEATRWAKVTPTIHDSPDDSEGRACRLTVEANISATETVEAAPPTNVPPTATPTITPDGICYRDTKTPTPVGWPTRTPTTTETPWNNGGIIIHGP